LKELKLTRLPSKLKDVDVGHPTTSPLQSMLDSLLLLLLLYRSLPAVVDQD
jgi:hypothetical protein